jgi:enamine deaminase RidA (YjgF/YER057c/UK114 family)
MITRTRDFSRQDAAMSKVVRVGGLLFLSGQVANDTRNGSVFEQTSEILSLIDGILQQVGSSRRDILHATVHLSRRASFSAMNAAWNEFIEPDNEPARTTVQAELYASGCDVEITVVAAVKS